MAMAASSSASSMGLASCVSVRNNTGGTVSPPQPPNTNTTSTTTPKPYLLSKKNSSSSLAEQLQPLSGEFLQRASAPAASRVWTSPTRRRKARDSPHTSTTRRNRNPAGGSAVQGTLSLLQQAASEETLTGLLDDEVSFLTCKDIVAILNAQTSWRRSLLFFNWLRSRSFQLNSYVYNVMLKILRKAEQWETAKTIVHDMVQSGTVPDNITYSTIISFALRCGCQDEALQWFSRMQEANCPPDAVTYCAVIDIHSKSGRLKQAEGLCSKMQEEIQPWDSVVYSQIMKLHGLQKDYDQMWDVYKKMQTENIVPNLVTYNSLIALLGNAGRSMQALRLFNDMVSYGLKPSPITLSLMFKNFAKTKHVNEAFQLHQRIKKEGWVMDSVVYNTLLSLCAQAGKVEEGEKICKELLSSKGCRPDDWTWRTLVDMYVKGGKLHEARRISKEMVSRGRLLDLPVYMCLVQGYGRNRDFRMVLELFDEIKGANMPLDHMLAGALLSVLVLCEEDGAEEAGGILERIELVHPELKKVINNLSMEGLGTEEIKNDMRSMLNATSEECRRPFCNLLMDLCWVKQTVDQAHELLSIAVSFGLYADLQTKSVIEWCLKLRTLSFGAARTALRSWISSLRSAVQEDSDAFPRLLSIEVGVGLQFTPDESVPVMSSFILKLLQEMNAPFEESKSGWISASSDDAKAWLSSLDSRP